MPWNEIRSHSSVPASTHRPLGWPNHSPRRGVGEGGEEEGGAAVPVLAVMAILGGDQRKGCAETTCSTRRIARERFGSRWCALLVTFRVVSWSRFWMLGGEGGKRSFDRLRTSGDGGSGTGSGRAGARGRDCWLLVRASGCWGEKGEKQSFDGLRTSGIGGVTGRAGLVGVETSGAGLRNPRLWLRHDDICLARSP